MNTEIEEVLEEPPVPVPAQCQCQEGVAGVRESSPMRTRTSLNLSFLNFKLIIERETTQSSGKLCDHEYLAT